jgi:hypothetical protein
MIEAAWIIERINGNAAMAGQDPPYDRLPCTLRTPYIATMPSFDIVSEVDLHELTNAVDQANRELTTRFDFKGVDATFALEDSTVALTAPANSSCSRCRTSCGCG